MAGSKSLLAEILRSSQQTILSEWIQEQLRAATLRPDLISESDLREQSERFLGLFQAAIQSGANQVEASNWQPVREFLEQFSRQRGLKGFSPSETATFVLSLKQPLFTVLKSSVKDTDSLVNEIWSLTVILDKLGLLTTEIHQKAREAVISRQQTDMLELSTPVVKLWDGVLALPMIGTLDSNRTQIVMESLLQKIVETGSSIAILDITGVPTVDTLVAQHLLKTVAAAKLMGAECIISGIRPQIAQTMVHLAIDMSEVTTKASLADAFKVALERLGKTVATMKSGDKNMLGASVNAPKNNHASMTM